MAFEGFIKGIDSWGFEVDLIVQILLDNLHVTFYYAMVQKFMTKKKVGDNFFKRTLNKLSIPHNFFFPTF
jgi:hypothetical protein